MCRQSPFLLRTPHSPFLLRIPHFPCVLPSPLPRALSRPGLAHRLVQREDGLPVHGEVAHGRREHRGGRQDAEVQRHPVRRAEHDNARDVLRRKVRVRTPERPPAEPARGSTASGRAPLARRTTPSPPPCALNAPVPGVRADDAAHDALLFLQPRGAREEACPVSRCTRAEPGLVQPVVGAVACSSPPPPSLPPRRDAPSISASSSRRSSEYQLPVAGRREPREHDVEQVTMRSRRRRRPRPRSGNARTGVGSPTHDGRATTRHRGGRARRGRTRGGAPGRQRGAQGAGRRNAAPATRPHTRPAARVAAAAPGFRTLFDRSRPRQLQTPCVRPTLVPAVNARAPCAPRRRAERKPRGLRRGAPKKKEAERRRRRRGPNRAAPASGRLPRGG